MTKKDFELIASVISDVSKRTRSVTSDEHKLWREGHESARLAVAVHLAHELKQRNPRFDVAKFITACNRDVI